MKRITICVFTILFSFSLYAQDFVFNQFHLSPLNVSPALTGTNSKGQFNANFRSYIFNRSKIKESIYAISSSYSRPFTLKNGDKIGVGMRYSYNTKGIYIENSLLNLSLNYQKKIGSIFKKDHYLIAGIDGGAGVLRAWYNEYYSDFSWGMGYRLKLDSRNDIQLGASVFHFNEAMHDQNNSSAFVHRRMNYYAIIGIPIFSKIDIRPRAFYTQNEQFSTFITTLGLRYAGKNHQVELYGGWQQFNDLTGNDTWRSVYTDYVLGATYFYRNLGISFTEEFEASKFYTSIDRTIELSIIYRPL